MDGWTGWITRVVLVAAALLHSPRSAEARNDVDFFNRLLRDYKPGEAPRARNGYIPVAVRAMLESIAVDEKGSAVTLQCLQRLTWTDLRLRYHSDATTGDLIVSQAAAGLPTSPKIWLPSLVYPRAFMVDFDNSMDNMFLIRYNGTLTWQRRVHLMVPCDIQLDSFPWDQNTCRATILQDLDAEVLMLNWTRAGGRPVQAGPHFSMNGFELTSVGSSSRSTTPNEAAAQSLRSKSLILRVVFKRLSSYYVVNDIIPTSILVLAAYMTFWLSPEAVMVRSLVASFMLLACFLVSAIASRAAPVTATLTALNIWNLVCLFLLLWPLVQSLVVYHMSGRAAGAGGGGSVSGDGSMYKSAELNGNGEADPEGITSDALPPPPPPNEDLGPLPPRPGRRRRPAGISARMVDVISRVLYLLAFVITAIVFGVLYS